MRHMVFVLFCAVVSVAVADDTTWIERDAAGAPQVQLYFFWSLACPHCEEARPHVEALAQRLPWLRLHSLELTREPDSRRRFLELARQTGQDAAVPAFVFCGEMRVGWRSADTTGAELEAALAACHQRSQAGAPPSPGPTRAPERVHVPALGDIDAATLSQPMLTLLLAGLDAFNPCAFFVLLFLLSMMAHQKSRGRMLAVGGIFVLFSGLMYFAFMAAWLNVFQLLGRLAWVTAAAGVVAVLIGILNIKDYFALRQGPSLSISDAGRQNIFRRARGILGADRLAAMLAATVLLAIAANFYELLCTAGFPMVYTRVLTLAEPSPAARYLYLALYNVIYVLPLAAIVIIFARSLGARKLSERQGRLLKLLSGIMMLELGALLLIAPDRTASAATGILLIAVAAGVTWLAARSGR
ncbi:MAG: hypothetical protein KJ634_10930 [Gammaproteobacteria bacterium]|nr:hypothetical protein [Gammaproteobacteria bacterium]MBU1416126.1 hypothetical protein [Gammaproteobacteria bacterium]